MFETATNAASTPIVPQNRFIVECLSLEEAPPYAPPGEQPKPGAKSGIRWILGLYDAASGERFLFQDEPYEFFQTTTANMQRGARAREYAEAFLAREIAEGELLKPDMLIGKRLVGMVIHELSKDKTKKNAKLVAVEPYKSAVPAAAAAAPSGGVSVMERPSQASVPPDASIDDIDRALMLSKFEKKIERARKKGLPSLGTFEGAYAAIASDTTAGQIEALIDSLDDAIDKFEDE